MDAEYDLFERLPDGTPVWRDSASGLRQCRDKLAEIARNTRNECFAIHLPTKEIVARLNVPEPPMGNTMSRAQ